MKNPRPPAGPRLLDLILALLAIGAALEVLLVAFGP